MLTSLNFRNEEQRWCSVPFHCSDEAQRGPVACLDGSAREARPPAAAGRAHQLRTYSVFNNQSPTVLDASGTTGSHSINLNEPPDCPVRRASELRVHSTSTGSLPPSGPGAG